MSGIHDGFAGQNIFAFARRKLPINDWFCAAKGRKWKTKFACPYVGVTLLSDSTESRNSWSQSQRERIPSCACALVTRLQD
eukprot:6018477-Pyramimonas_sp.AAC.1